MERGEEVVGGSMKITTSPWLSEEQRVKGEGGKGPGGPGGPGGEGTGAGEKEAGTKRDEEKRGQGGKRAGGKRTWGKRGQGKKEAAVKRDGKKRGDMTINLVFAFLFKCYLPHVR